MRTLKKLLLPVQSYIHSLTESELVAFIQFSNRKTLRKIYCSPRSNLTPADHLFLHNSLVAEKVIDTLDEQELIVFLHMEIEVYSHSFKTIAEFYFENQSAIVQRLINKMSPQGLITIFQIDVSASCDFFKSQSSVVCQALITKLNSKALSVICQVHNNIIGTPTHYLFEYQDSQICESLIDKLDSKIVSTLCRVQDISGHTPTHYLFDHGDSRSCLALINKLDSQELSIACEMQEQCGYTPVHSLFKGKDLASLAFINKLDSKALSKNCRMKGGHEVTPTHFLFEKGNAKTCLALISKLDAEALSEICLIQGFYLWRKATPANLLFTYQDGETCLALINKLNGPALLKIANQEKDKIVNQLTNLTLKFMLADYWNFLQNPQASVQQKPSEFILFLHQRLQTWRSFSDARFMIELIQRALEATHDQTIRGTLFILLFKLYLSMEFNLSRQLIEEKEKQLFSVPYREKAHQMLLSIEQPKQINCDSQDLVISAESLIIAGSGGEDYLTAIKNITTREGLPLFRSMQSANCHRIRRKGFELLTAALQQTAEAKKDSPEHHTFQGARILFLSYLAPEEEDQLGLELKDWLNHSSRGGKVAAGEEQGLDNSNYTRFTIEEKLKELETRAQRVEIAEGWMLFSEALVDYITETEVQDTEKEEFRRELLLLKYHYEIAIGMEEDAKARNIVLNMQERLSQKLGCHSGILNSTALTRLRRLMQLVSSVHPLVAEVSITEEAKEDKTSTESLLTIEPFSSEITTPLHSFSKPAEIEVKKEEKANTKSLLIRKLSFSDITLSAPFFITPTEVKVTQGKEKEEMEPLLGVSTLEASAPSHEGTELDNKEQPDEKEQKHLNFLVPTAKSMKKKMKTVDLIRKEVTALVRTSPASLSLEQGILLQLGDKIFDLENRCSTCLTCDETIKVLREKKRILQILYTELSHCQNLDLLQPLLYEYRKNKVVNTFCYTRYTSSSSLFSIRTGTRRLLDKISLALVKKNSLNGCSQTKTLVTSIG